MIGCGIICHAKCAPAIHQPCMVSDSPGHSGERTPKSPWKCEYFSFFRHHINHAWFFFLDVAPSPLSNNLVKQVQIEGGSIPLLVQKCIEAVERRGQLVKNGMALAGIDALFQVSIMKGYIVNPEE